jgi:hypothetical protein
LAKNYFRHCQKSDRFSHPQKEPMKRLHTEVFKQAKCSVKKIHRSRKKDRIQCNVAGPHRGFA